MNLPLITRAAAKDFLQCLMAFQEESFGREEIQKICKTTNGCYEKRDKGIYMSVNVMVCGADQTTDEYIAALKLKRIILDSLPWDAIGEIVLFASATLMGQAVKDIDILMIGEVKNYSVDAEFCTEANGCVKEKVVISSFCTTIEVKGHDISGILVNGTDFYVKYGAKTHCVTDQSNKQKIAAKNFFERTLMDSPFVTNVIWFTQTTPGDIKKLLANNGRTMPSNVLGRDFDFKELVQLLIWQKPPYKKWDTYIFDSNHNSNSLQTIKNAMSLFSKTKAHMGEMTRRRIEQLTNKAFQADALIDAQGKVSIYRGRAGTGKTVGLLQTAIHLVDEKQARVLMLTYNKALVSDIRRLLALAELPDMFEENCLHINTMHSYFFQLTNTVLYNGRMRGNKFLEKYDSILKELLSFMNDNDTVEMVKEICASDSILDWDYVLIDEAQDWSNLERDIILKLFDKGKIIVADGGQQFVRRINVCDWSVIRDRNNIKLKYCLRQKENLVAFVNAYSQKLDILGSKILTKNNAPGGKVIITTDDKIFSVHHQEMQRLSDAGNIAYDMLYLVPHELVKRNYGDSSFALKTKFEQNGIFIWDGTSSDNRENYSIDAEEMRLLQYDSARGLEGWTVVCMDFDVFLKEKSAEYQDGSVDALMLESQEERKQKYLYNWAMIPLTRAIDTIIITIKDQTSETARLLKRISEEHPDFVSWL